MNNPAFCLQALPTQLLKPARSFDLDPTETKMNKTNRPLLSRCSLSTLMLVAGLMGSLPLLSTSPARAQSHHYHGGLTLLSEKEAGNLAIMDGTKGYKMNGFGRLFPLRTSHYAPKDAVAPQTSSKVDLAALGHKMTEPTSWQGDPGRKSHVPSGYIFFGQFIDHDITLDVMSSLDKPLQEGRLRNRRSPDLDMDNIYGDGPDASPYLYNLPYLRVGKLIKGVHTKGQRRDLLRVKATGKWGPQGGGATALIGDPRNDENFALSQLEAAMIAFHNSIVNRLVEQDYGERRAEICKGKRCKSPEALAAQLSGSQKRKLFEKARDHVIHYYHRIILEDFLPRLIGAERTAQLKKNGRIFYFPKGFVRRDGHLDAPYIPFEFSVAAYRYGHTMVHQNYRLRENPDSKIPLFAPGNKKTGELPVHGFTPITSRVTIDWNYFFPIKRQTPSGFNFANKMAPYLAKHLQRLDLVGVTGKDQPALAARNLIRGRVFRMPSGQSLARVVLPALAKRGILKNWGISNPANWGALVLAPDSQTAHTLANAETPLWYYVLQEAAAFKRADEAGLTESSAGEQDLTSTDRLPSRFEKLPGFVSASAAPVRKTPLRIGRYVKTSHHQPALGERQETINNMVIAGNTEDVFNSYLGDQPARTKRAPAATPQTRPHTNQPYPSRADRPVAAPSPARPSAPASAYQGAPKPVIPQKTVINPTAPSYGSAHTAGRFAPSRVALSNIGGDTLGPVGGTIVGEVLTGLLEHYREETGKGLDYVPQLKATPTPHNELSLHHYNPLGGLTATRDQGVRYQMRNLLYDTGLAFGVTVRTGKPAKRRSHRSKRRHRRRY